MRIVEEPFLAGIDLWVDPNGPGGAAASTELGTELPGPGRVAEGTNTTAIWLGPEEWLVIGAGLDPVELEHRLGTAVREHRGAATDVSAQRTSLRLSGSRARDVLAKGCSIDLHPRIFPAGSTVQTMLAMAGMILIACDDTGTDYRILVRSSFARYLAAWLTDAAEEYTDVG